MHTTTIIHKVLNWFQKTRINVNVYDFDSNICVNKGFGNVKKRS